MAIVLLSQVLLTRFTVRHPRYPLIVGVTLGDSRGLRWKPKQAALLEASRLLEEAVVLIAAGGRPGLAADVAELITAVDAACVTESCAA